MAFELGIWRAVALHLELRAALASISHELLSALPAREVVVRHLDLEGRRLVTRARIGAHREELTADVTDLPPETIATLESFVQRGAPTLLRARDERIELQAVVPREMAPPLVCVPLKSALGTMGVVLLRGVAARAPSDAALRRLAEPLSAGLENDQRLRELVRLQQASLADKRALLSRLERQDISESIVGAQTGLREVMERIEQVAPTDAPVLILGETGAGKEVVARAIHERSRRARGPLVRVNCGAIPPELVDSELFGHERGSFTGAVSSRPGWFERADGGVLFLDEVGELPLAAQVRLLRILQDGVLTRVGGHKSVTVDVRVVAATHRDLSAMVTTGAFRQDLWYRISVFPIRLPPLRERLQDVPALASSFVRGACRRLGLPELPLTKEDIHALVSYTWPGNVRELAAVIERATILGGGKQLCVAQALGASTPTSAHGTLAPAGPGSLDDAMTDHIRAALKKTYGRIEGPFGAAKLLAINPHTLRARMRKLGIDWRAYRSA